MDTEEPGSAQPKLESAIDGLAGVKEESVAYVEALNNLGVVWCNRGEAEKALERLEKAREAHAAITAEQQQASSPPDEGVALRLEDARTLSTFYLAQVYGNLGRTQEAASHCHETMRRQLLRRGVSKEADLAARAAALAVGGAGADLAYGSETKSEFAFDAQEWARNACDLSKYYSTIHRLDIAEHCLHAAEAVLAAGRRKDAEKRAKAAAAKKKAEEEAAAAAKAKEESVDVSDGTAAAAAVEKAGIGEDGDGPPLITKEKVKVDAKGDNTNRIFLNGTADDKAEAERVAANEAKESANAASRSMTEDEAEQAALVDLAWARLWLAALKRAAELKVETAESYSGPSSQEKDGKALGPLSSLSFDALKLPAASKRLIDLKSHAKDFEGARELYKLGAARATRSKATLVLDGFVTMHFEVLEVECELYAQLAMWEGDMKRRHAMHKRRLELLQGPISELSEKAYAQLVRQGLFDCSTIASEMLEIKNAMVPQNAPTAMRQKKIEKDVQLAVDACTAFLSRFDTGEGGKPTGNQVEEAQERAYLQCHFHRARAYGRIETPDSLGKALNNYELIRDYLTKYKVEGMEQEMQASKEMAELLPHKIKNAMKAAQNPNFVAAGVHQNPNVVKDPAELAKIAKAMGQ